MKTLTDTKTDRRFWWSVALAAALLGRASNAHAQWAQWGQNGGHTSFLPDVVAQPPNRIGWKYQFDLNPPTDEFLIHYAAPLVLADGNLIVALRHNNGGVRSYDVVKLDSSSNVIWGPIASDYQYPNHNWEPVFQPIVANGNVYYPGAGGVLHVRSVDDGTPGVDIVSNAIPPGADLAQLAATVFVGGVAAADSSGTIYYTIRTQGVPPPGVRNQVVKATVDGTVIHADFADLTGDPGFVAPLNAGAAIAANGSIYVVTRRSSPSEQNRLLGLNQDLSLACTGNLDQIAAKQARIIDDSSSVPVVGPDGRVFYGGWNSNGLSRGYLYEFSSGCQFLGYYDFGWDDTPGIYQPDPTDPTTYYVVEKDNHYENGDHVGPYYITALDPNIDSGIVDDNLKVMNVQWQFTAPPGQAGNYEWCINQPAVDMNGTVLVNSEDGNYYAIPWGGMSYARQALQAARDAAYTPLAVASDGTVYTLNSGVLFQIKQ